MSMKTFWKGVRDEAEHLRLYADQNSPFLFMVTGVGLMAVGAYEAWKKAPVAKEKLDTVHMARSANEIKMSKSAKIVEDFVTIAPDVLPVIGLELAGGLCCIKSYKSSAKKLATTAALLGLSQDRSKLLEDRLLQEVGEERASEIKKEVDKDLEEREETSKTSTGRFNGVEYLLKDKISGQYFIASAAAIHNAAAEVNGLLDPVNGGEDFVELNYLYELLGLEGLGEGLGEAHGFTKECPCSIYINCDHGEMRKDKIPFNIIEFDYVDRPDPRALH